MTPPIGPILTYAQSPADVRIAASTMRADLLKVCTAWGLACGWTDDAIAEVARLCGTLNVRTSHGDPASFGGTRPCPFANQVLDEVRPWARARPDLVIEIGNEPLNGPIALDPYVYAYHLGEAITAVAAVYPRARILAPAFSLHSYTPNIDHWLSVLAPHYRRSEVAGVAIHAYTESQLAMSMGLIRLHVGACPMWLTEVNLGGEMPSAERGRQIWALIRRAPIVAAAVYHLDLSSSEPTAEQGPSYYRLQPDTLAALGLRDESLGAAASPQRPPVTSVPMTNEHLTRGRVRPISVLVLHATAGQSPGDFAYLKRGGSLTNPVSCHYYIDKTGHIAQFVADHDTAWHAGVSQWRGLEVWSRTAAGVRVPSLNPVAIGIELENRNDGKDVYPEAQIAAAVALARQLTHEHRIVRTNLVRHLDISPGRKTDPAGLRWPSFVDRVYEGRP
jgi:N-acetyl-anhydromuramyl-L-alanine amidase AmpD